MESSDDSSLASPDGPVLRTYTVHLSHCKDIMIPAGYLAKQITERPEWLKEAGIQDVYSVSNCISKPFTDYVSCWKHNGNYLFDSPQVILDLSAEHNIDLTGMKLFYYEVYELQFDEIKQKWTMFALDPELTTQVDLPASKTLEGFDIVTYSCQQAAECSPLSCNLLATELDVNEHCLLTTFDQAKKLLDDGRFRNSEPGPFRIFAVYSVQWR